jgi:hypothetical protein
MADEHPLIQHEVEMDLLAESYRWIFAGMNPVPWKYFSEKGVSRYHFEGREYCSAHPVTRLWFKVPAGRYSISVEIGLLADAYDDSVPYGDRSDGVELKIVEEPAGGPVRPVYSRWLNPRDQAADRGMQRLECIAEFPADTVVQISVLPGPNDSNARDWALLGRIEIK